MKNFAQSLLDLWKQLGLNQRVSLVVAALAVAGGLGAIVFWSQQPDYQLLYARLGEKDGAAVIGYLEAQNIPHRVTSGGSAVQVPSNMVYKLRMDLAGKGLPSGEGVGFEIFDKGQFGLSDFVQRTNYLRALHKVGEAKLALVENLEAHAVATRESLAGEIHAELVNLVSRHRHGGAAGGDLVRDILRLEIADDGRGVLLAHARVEELHIRALGPKHHAHEPADHREGGDDERDPLVEAELFPEIEERLGKIFHRAV